MPKAAGYKLATYQAGSDARAGLVVGDQVFDAAAVTGKARHESERTKIGSEIILQHAAIVTGSPVPDAASR